MSVDSPVVIDHVALGLSRVATQYRESPRFLAFLTALLSSMNELESVFQYMMWMTDVDTMKGAQLDVIGRIVGTSRKIDTVVYLSYFGFEDTGYYATPFGEEGRPDIGARFYEEGEPLVATTSLRDPEFRMLIKAKIIKNSSHATNEDIIRGVMFLFDTLDVKITDNLDMSFSLSIGRPLYAVEQALLNSLDILPRPAGVRVAGSITSYVPINESYTGGDAPYGDQ